MTKNLMIILMLTSAAIGALATYYPCLKARCDAVNWDWEKDWENGVTMVFDGNGERLLELQIPWFMIYLEWLESKGVEPSEIRFDLPDGHAYKAKKMADGYYVWERECPCP